MIAAAARHNRRMRGELDAQIERCARLRGLVSLLPTKMELASEPEGIAGLTGSEPQGDGAGDGAHVGSVTALPAPVPAGAAWQCTNSPELKSQATFPGL